MGFLARHHAQGESWRWSAWNPRVELSQIVVAIIRIRDDTWFYHIRELQEQLLVMMNFGDLGMELLDLFVHLKPTMIQWYISYFSGFWSLPCMPIPTFYEMVSPKKPTVKQMFSALCALVLLMKKLGDSIARLAKSGIACSRSRSWWRAKGIWTWRSPVRWTPAASRSSAPGFFSTAEKRGCLKNDEAIDRLFKLKSEKKHALLVLYGWVGSWCSSQDRPSYFRWMWAVGLKKWDTELLLPVAELF